MKCWICGQEATTGEHLLKAASLRELFTTVSQAQPIFYNSERKRNKRLQSIDSKYLKSKSLCAPCNSGRTQAADRAFDILMSYLKGLPPKVLAQSSVRMNRLFPYGTRAQSVQLHLYFVKLFGCLVREGDVPIDLADFSAAICSGKPHPGIYVAVGLMDKALAGGAGTAGLSDIHCDFYQDGKPAFVAWFIHMGNVCIQVMLAAAGEHRDGLINSWHPSRNKQLLLREFPKG